MISVYGGHGFIGSAFRRISPGQVINIPRYQRKPESNSILYLISTTHNHYMNTEPYRDIETNLRVLIDTLLNCVDQDITFNFVSSWFVYGNPKRLPVKECDPCNPMGWYSITKLCAERLLVSFCQQQQIKYRIFRLANVYGVGDKFSVHKNALQYLTFQLASGKDVGVFYSGEFIRDYLYVDDVANALWHGIQATPLNQVYHIGGNRPRTFLYMLETARSFLKGRHIGEIVNKPLTTTQTFVKNMWLDSSKFYHTGFFPQTTTEYGLYQIAQEINSMLPLS